MESIQDDNTDIHHYNLKNKSLIGVGSRGNRIYKVTNTTDNQVYALKKVIINPNIVERYTNELTILKKVNHPNIIKYHESFTNKGKLYIVMEYATGGDLKSAINVQISKGYEYFPEFLVAKWLSQIVDAIQYIHSMNILHRDIKPQNIFITSDNNVKLGDFGISKEMESAMDFAHSEVGTPSYLSPEICRGEKYNFKTDIWTLGCLLYEICALESPFISEAINALICNIITTDPKPLKNTNYSKEIQQLIFEMLKKNPNERPDINEIKKRIGDLLSDPVKTNVSVDIQYKPRRSSNGSIISREHRVQSLPSPTTRFMVSASNKNEGESKQLQISFPCHKKSVPSCSELGKVMKKDEISPFRKYPINKISSKSPKTAYTSTAIPNRKKTNSYFERQIIQTEKNMRKISLNNNVCENNATNSEKKICGSLSQKLLPQSHLSGKSNDTKRRFSNKYTEKEKRSPKYRTFEENKQEFKKIQVNQIIQADKELRHEMIIQFLLDRYGKKNYAAMNKMIEEGNNEKLMAKVTDLLGKDESKIAFNYLKYLASK